MGMESFEKQYRNRPDCSLWSVSMLFGNRTTKHLNCISALQEVARVIEHQKTIT